MSMMGTLEIQTKVTGASEAAGQLGNVKGAVQGAAGAQKNAETATKAASVSMKDQMLAANKLKLKRKKRAVEVIEEELGVV